MRGGSEGRQPRHSATQLSYLTVQKFRSAVETRRNRAKPYKFIGFGALDVTKPYKIIGCGALDVTKPYKFIGFGAMDAPQNEAGGLRGGSHATRLLNRAISQFKSFVVPSKHAAIGHGGHQTL